MTNPENQLIKVRREKLERLRTAGIDPYPHTYHRTHTASQAVDLFELEEKGDAYRLSNVSIAGRVVAFRDLGKITFMDILDERRRIQTLFRRDLIPKTYQMLHDGLDIGDWIGVEGSIFRTKRGEVTLEVEKWVMLSKSLRPLPEKWHGLTDVEARFRQRYLDLIASPAARDIAIMRSQIVKSLRHFMDDRGFMEVETPVLVSVPAGAMARPFKTHHNSLNRDLYLRIATELYLKKLIVGGLEKVYEIGRVFRNEGLDFYHNPEFTMMESYEAYSDYNDVMNMVEQAVSTLAMDVLGTMLIELGGEEFDLTPPWPRLNLHQEVRNGSGIDFLKSNNFESLQVEMNALGLDTGQQNSWGGLLDKLISDTVEPKLQQPCFLVDYPVEMSPLAKRNRQDQRLVERFEGFIAGMEICNAFTELNDPIDQRQRFEQQEVLHKQHKDVEADRLDEDFLIAIEHGMPPTGGLGMGIDRLVMLLSGHRNIKEVVLFPQLRS